ncbi:MAG: hypothetical protein R3217_08355 [Gammaproteobacteria bacterium]|nr:hypothetical protein [Gammaproteobacteria bacterium]
MMNDIPMELTDKVIRQERRRQLAHQVLLTFFLFMAGASVLFGIDVLISGKVSVINALAGFGSSAIALFALLGMWKTQRRERMAMEALSLDSHAAIELSIETAADHGRALAKARGFLPLLAVIFAMAIGGLLLDAKVSVTQASIMAIVLLALHINVWVVLGMKLDACRQRHAALEDLAEQFD